MVIWKNIYGEEHDAVAASYNKLGLVHREGIGHQQKDLR